MELIKRNIHMNMIKCKSSMQMTIDNDINVPDVKPDINMVIRENGEIKIHEIKPANGKVLLKGVLMFHILYEDTDSESHIQHMEGQIPFDEVVNMDNACGEDNVHVKWELEGLSAEIINSRKINIKAVLKLTTMAEELVDEEAAVDISDEPYIEKLYSDKMISELALSNKDVCRIKDEVILPSGRDSIREIIYEELVPEEVEMRLIQDKLSIRGTLKVFILYKGAEDEGICDFESKITFSDEVQCSGCDENMISYVEIVIQDKDIQIKADEDGEDRIIDIEAVAALDIKVYKEEPISLLADLYSTSNEIIPVFKDIMLENIVMRNNSKVRINDRLTIDSDNPAIMQICSAQGAVRIDDEEIVNGGIEVSGVIEVQLMYFTEGEGRPVSSYIGAIPFTHLIEARGINDDCIYEINPMVEQIHVMVIDGNETEIKAVIGMDTIVFNRFNQSVITDYQISEKDMETFWDIPGLTGYIVQRDDSLWSIAKKFSTTMDSIKEMNDIETEDVSPGQKLLLIKQVDML